MEQQLEGPGPGQHNPEQLGTRALSSRYLKRGPAQSYAPYGLPPRVSAELFKRPGNGLQPPPSKSVGYAVDRRLRVDICSGNPELTFRETAGAHPHGNARLDSLMKFRWLAGCATVVLLSGYTLATPALANHADLPESEQAHVDMVTVPDEWQDLAGEQKTVPKEVAEQLEVEFAQQTLRDIGQVIYDTAETHPDFSFAYQVDERFVVGFRNEAPAEIRDVLLKSGRIDIEENSGFGARELEAAGSQISNAVMTGIDGLAATGVGFNPQKRTVDINVGSFGADDLDSVQARVVEAAVKVGTFGFEPVVTVGYTPDGGIELLGYGQSGGMLLSQPSQVDPCTSSFVAKKTNSPMLGVFTAGHCGNTLRQLGWNGSPSYWFLGTYNEHFGANGDQQFMHSPVMMDAWFHYVLGQGRAVLDVRNAYMNEPIWKYGVTTGADPGTVIHDNYSMTTYSPLMSPGTLVTLAGLTRVGASMEATGGDSGGPLYGGNTAMGMASLRETIGNAVIFTKVSNMQIQSGAVVCIVVCS